MRLFKELLATLLPIVNFRQLQRFLKNVLHLKSLRTKPTTVAQDREGTEKTEKSEASPKFTEESVCVNCEQRPHMPQFTDCAHIYCYYCLKSNILADKHFQCVVCDRPVSINSGQLNTSNHRSSLIWKKEEKTDHYYCSCLFTYCLSSNLSITSFLILIS